MPRYKFPAQVARNRAGQLVSSGSFAAYAVGDLTFSTPLALFDLDNAPTATVDVTEFVTDEFQVDDHPEVYLKSGTAPAIYLASTTGMRDLTESAAADAADAADRAEAAEAAAMDAAALVDAPADSVAAGLVTNPATSTRAALDAAFVQAAENTTYYVNPTTGSDTNDGSSGAPFATVGKAVELAEGVAQRRATAVTINLAAGTYAERVVFSDYTSQALNVTIAGPDVGGHPNVPTAVFTEGGSASAVAILSRNRNLRLTVKDVKFVGYRGTTSSSGVTVLTSHLWAVNVHASQCFYALSSQNGAIDVKGGIFDDCGRLPDTTGSGAAIRSLMLNRHSIGTQNAGSLALGPVFTSNRAGVWAQESSTGHVDWCTFEDNERGVLLRVSSRANADGSSFKRNFHAILADSNSHAFVSSNVTMGTGADANSNTVTLLSGAESTSTAYIGSVDVSQSRTEQAVWGTYAAQTLTGTTAETDFLNRTLKAPHWNDYAVANYPPKRLRVRLVGTLTGTVGTKTIRLRVGTAQAGAVFSTSETGVFVLEGWCYFASPTRQVLTITTTRHLSASSRLANAVAALDMTADQTVRVTGALGDASDTVTVDVVEMFWA